MAERHNASLKVFDANNSPQTQYSQLQDVINSGQYSGIIVQPIFGTGLLSLVKQAISKGIKVVNMDQILGPDLSTDQPQVTGLSATSRSSRPRSAPSSARSSCRRARPRTSTRATSAICTTSRRPRWTSPCSGAFNKAIAADPAVKVVAQGQSFFSPTEGLTAVQNMLQANPNLNLIVGSDQGIEGGAQAAGSRAPTGKVILVGYGASAAALAGVASGAWYADVAQAPGQRGPAGRAGAGHRRCAPARAAAASTRSPSCPTAASSPRPNATQFTAEWPG